MGPVMSTASTYPRQLAGRLAGTRIDRQCIIELVTKAIEVYQQVDEPLNGPGRHGGTRAIFTLNNVALKAQESGRVEVRKAMEGFLIHPPQELSQSHEIASHGSRALRKTGYQCAVADNDDEARRGISQQAAWRGSVKRRPLGKSKSQRIRTG